MKPKKWTKKYCKKDFVICDGMSADMPIFDWLSFLIILAIPISGYILWKILHYKNRKKR